MSTFRASNSRRSSWLCSWMSTFRASSSRRSSCSTRCLTSSWMDCLNPSNLLPNSPAPRCSVTDRKWLSRASNEARNIRNCSSCAASRVCVSRLSSKARRISASTSSTRRSRAPPREGSAESTAPSHGASAARAAAVSVGATPAAAQPASASAEPWERAAASQIARARSAHLSSSFCTRASNADDNTCAESSDAPVSRLRGASSAAAAAAAEARPSRRSRRRSEASKVRRKAPKAEATRSSMSTNLCCNSSSENLLTPPSRYSGLMAPCGARSTIGCTCGTFPGLDRSHCAGQPRPSAMLSSKASILRRTEANRGDSKADARGSDALGVTVSPIPAASNDPTTSQPGFSRKRLAAEELNWKCQPAPEARHCGDGGIVHAMAGGAREGRLPRHSLVVT
mmetsp:Transcript_9418/g.33317  ORF Transcript_9418/g.33317 Transcript_9418/m.33317 type:complete len:397 (-) Transcript_9418:7-1197(-)